MRGSLCCVMWAACVLSQGHLWKDAYMIQFMCDPRKKAHCISLIGLKFTVNVRIPATSQEWHKLDVQAGIC